MMEMVIIILVVMAAAIYVGRVFYRGVRQKGDCTCGCTCCDITDSCDALASEPARDSSASHPDP